MSNEFKDWMYDKALEENPEYRAVVQILRREIDNHYNHENYGSELSYLREIMRMVEEVPGNIKSAVGVADCDLKKGK